ncbi:MAG: hypothetical protein VW270_19330 [Candidatus Poseidoniales archaeon]
MGAVKDMLMDVEEFVYDFYDKDGQLTETYPVIITKAKEKFGICFGEYAEEVLNGVDGEYDMRQAEAEYHAELASINERIPF